MHFFQTIFRSKLNILMLVIFLVTLVSISVFWLNISSSNNSPILDVTSTQNSQQLQSVDNDQSAITTVSSSKGNGTKASFEDLDKSKSIVKSSSSITALASPIASTPELDAAQISELLEKVEQPQNDDDVQLDNQILQN